MTAFVDSAMAAGRGIGRYFSVVGMVPAMVAVGWVAFLLAAGAWTGPMQLQHGLRALSGLGVVEISVLIAIALAVGLVVNPFQFTATQWLEGYWGGGNLAAGIAARRINRYRRLLRGWDRRGLDAEKALIAAVYPANEDDRPELHDDRLDEALEELHGEDGDSLIRLDQVRRYYHRLKERYPAEPARVMPTRFGNVLRAFEDRAGRQYNLDAVVVAPHLSLLGPNPRASYVES